MAERGAGGQRALAENARLPEELAPRDTEIEQMAAELAILKRLLFGRSSERARRTRRAVTGSWRSAVRAAGLLASAPSVVAGAGLLVVRVRVAGR